MTDQAALSQKPDIVIPIPQTTSETVHPYNIMLHTMDSKTLDQRHSENDRQHPDETYNHTPECPRKRDSIWWAYQILVGKDYYELKQEKKNMKRVDWIIHEIRSHLGEFIGTFFLVFFVAGIQINQDLFPGGGVANIDKGIVSGFVLTGLIYCFGKVSGAHFNPCVTLAFLLRGSFNFYRAVTYILVQFGGAVAGAAVLYHFFGNVGPGLGTTTPAPGLEHKYALEIEMLITYLLITVILTTTKHASLLSAIAGLAVGSTFGAIEIFAWNFTGASVNPWRTIGPTMISGVGWNTYWIYIVGPLCGTVLAVIVERIMSLGAPDQEKRESSSQNDGSMAQSKVRYR